MKKEEIDILGIKKSKEGKSFSQIQKEINDLNNFQYNLCENKKVIFSQKDLINKQQREIDKLRKRVMELELSQSTKKEDNIGELGKILELTTNERVPKQELRALCKLEKEKFEQIIKFLKKNRLVKEERSKGLFYYTRE